MSVAVVGAGLAGLAAARALLAQGHDVTVLEVHRVGRWVGPPHERVDA